MNYADNPEPMDEVVNQHGTETLHTNFIQKIEISPLFLYSSIFPPFSIACPTHTLIFYIPGVNVFIENRALFYILGTYVTDTHTSTLNGAISQAHSSLSRVNMRVIMIIRSCLIWSLTLLTFFFRTMDFKTDELTSEFTFSNPNSKGQRETARANETR